MLIWPAISVFGFVFLAVLVIALGSSSTARYEFERNQVQRARQHVGAAAGPGSGAAGDGPANRPAPNPTRVAAGGGSARTQADAAAGLAAGKASHPAGKRGAEPVPASAWWLVEDLGDALGEILAGPFPDAIDADWAALACDVSADTRAVYGIPRSDGLRVARQQVPQERAWLGELGDQLDRLGEDWDELLSDEDALTTMVVEVAAVLVAAGLALHDCAGEAPAGGVCLTPGPGHRGIVVSWHRHERMNRPQTRSAASDAVVQRTMNAALAELLAELGFAVEPFGTTGCSLVTGMGREG